MDTFEERCRENYTDGNYIGARGETHRGMRNAAKIIRNHKISFDMQFLRMSICNNGEYFTLRTPQTAFRCKRITETNWCLKFEVELNLKRPHQDKNTCAPQRTCHETRAQQRKALQTFARRERGEGTPFPLAVLTRCSLGPHTTRTCGEADRHCRQYV